MATRHAPPATPPNAPPPSSAPGSPLTSPSEAATRVPQPPSAATTDALIVRARGQASALPAARRAGRRGPGTFDSLHDAGFRWFFLSTLGQMSAVMMQILVRGFLVFDLTGSFAALGVLSLASAVPQLLFGFYGGVLADRLPKKHVVMVGQIVGFANVALMGVLATAGILEYWHLVLSGAGSGLLVGMMMPARQAMVHEVVGGERLMNAVSLNTSAMNITQILAPSIGGVLFATIGAGGAFFVMAGCYAFASIALAFVPKAPPAKPDGPPLRSIEGFRRGFHDIADGFRYVRRNKEIRAVLMLSFFVALLGSAYMPILPGFVTEVFDGGAETLGLLTSVSAVGSLVGALVLASLPDRRRGLLLIASSVILGAGLLAFSASNVLWLSGLFMVFVGVGQAGRQSISNTLLQAYSANAYRGRVMAVFMTQFSMMSLGAFLIGMVAGAVGVQWAMAGMAVGLVAVSLSSIVTMPRLRVLA